MFNGPVFNNEVVQANSRAVNNAGFSESLDEANSLHSRLTGASFELVPSSYRGGIVYSGVPNTGNGDITWTRGSDAFRTNASGLLQRVPWNLVQYSEQFDNSAWIKNNATITSNAINAPNGTLTADKLIETTANGVHNAVFVLSPNVTTYTASFYAKAAERNFVYYSFGGPSWGGQGFMVNLTTGAVSQNTTGTTPTVTLLPDGWVKIEASRAAVSTTQIQFQIFTGLDSTTFSYTGDSTKGIYIWGAQLVEGTTAQTYLPTTDRLNFPRLDYTYGSCPSALLEPQRTNLCLYSQNFADTSWVTLNSTRVSTTQTDPSGFSTALNVTWASGGSKYFYRTQSGLTVGTTYTLSFYVKSSNSSKFRIYSESLGFTTSNLTSTSDFARYTLTFTATVTSGTIGLQAASDNTAADLIVAFAQLEAGAYPTTYIPTTTTSVTRLAESFTRNNIYTNGLITAAGGTWFVELRNNIAYVRDNTSAGLFISDDINNSVGNSFYIQATGSDRLRISKRVSGTGTQIFLTTTNTVKIAIKWNGSTADLFVNGTKQVSATAFPTTNMEYLNSINTDTPKFIQQMALFPTPLSDDQCIALTSDFTEGESVIGSYERYVNSNGGAVENLNTITNLIQNLK